MFDMATKLYYRELPDSAYMYYKATATSAMHGGNINDSILSAKAFNMCGVIDFYRGRYLDAYNNYMQALDIGGEHRFYWIKISLAGVFNVYDSYDDAENLLMQVYRTAKTNRQWPYLLDAYAVLVGKHMLSDNTGELNTLLMDFNSLHLPKNSKGPEIFLLAVSDGMTKYVRKDYMGAISKFREAQKLSDHMWTPLSGSLGCQVYIAKTFLTNNQPDSALNCLTSVEKKAYDNKIFDVCLDIYPLMSKCWDAKGEKALSDCSRLRYYELRDSLLNLSDLAKIKSTDYQREIAKYEQSLLEVNAENKLLNERRIYIIAITVILLILLIIICVQNRKLTLNNRLLFAKNKEMLNTESLLRDSTKMKSEADIDNNPDVASDRITSDNAPSELDNTTPVNTSLNEDYDSLGSEDKIYPGNIDIADHERMRIKNAIDRFFLKSDEWLSPDFNMDRLVQIVGSNKLYVSQVINNDMDTNYHELLNSYRIKEVCRRLINIEEYGNMTIETMALNVGYRSRSNFIKNFKKQTGLTPKTWQALAHKDFISD